MKKPVIPGLTALLFLITLNSCEYGPWGCLRGNGIMIEETRDLNTFSGVISEGDFDVTIIVDTVYQAVIEADENLMSFISTYIRGGNLVIDNSSRRCLRNSDGNPIYIELHVPFVDYISLTGSGVVYCQDLLYVDYIRAEVIGSGIIDLRYVDAISIDAILTGSGEIELWGICKEGDLNIPGSGVIKAFHLEQDICDANISGSGDMYVFVYDILDANISGSGNIFYKGNPRVSTRISGTGSIINSN
ncbi:MAG: DUF2807 domain-containing protein [Bacteroidales bacterium]|nr:DUF2807 domain-containing protein [Bacteroidales bacterium]